MESEAPTLYGMVALVVGTLAYCWGSIISRPLLGKYPPTCMSAFHMFAGGAGLMVTALVFEPVDGGTLRAFAAAPVLASWLFLVLAAPSPRSRST